MEHKTDSEYLREKQGTSSSLQILCSAAFYFKEERFLAAHIEMKMKENEAGELITSPVPFLLIDRSIYNSLTELIQCSKQGKLEKKNKNKNQKLLQGIK